ncbi:MAG: CDP-alcohol phosphatidyltransferase family protein [Firmicutes bacterium]|nr:CDP-alcohol phosphatidyltransferase family protein [Bacillota bacterium]
MNKRPGLLGYYNYTVYLTYLGMLAGFCGILQVLQGNYRMAVILLLAAGFCDMFDGAVASTKKDRTRSERSFGIQIDSLSDLICFGVLPAAIGYSLSGRGLAALLAASFYVLCALIRLAYFNVDEQERQQREDTSRKLYYGLPVTSSALVIPILYGAAKAAAFSPAPAMLTALAVMACLFLTPFSVQKPGKVIKGCLLAAGFAVIFFVILSR